MTLMASVVVRPSSEEFIRLFSNIIFQAVTAMYSAKECD